MNGHIIYNIDGVVKTAPLTVSEVELDDGTYELEIELANEEDETTMYEQQTKSVSSNDKIVSLKDYK